MQPSELEEASDRIRRRFAEGAVVEEILAELRGGGADKIDSIRILKLAMNISLGAAKNLVDLSEVWSDRYADDQAFHGAVWKVSSQLERGEGTEMKILIDRCSSEPKPD